MQPNLYLNKAIMQFSRGMSEGAQSLEIAAQSEDEVCAVQAKVMLAEYCVMKGEFTRAKELLESVADQSEELEQKYDDLLNDEIMRADMLLDMIERFWFVAER